MKFDSYHCEFCGLDFLASEGMCVRLDFSARPYTIKEEVGEWYTGIRCICLNCVRGLSQLYGLKRLKDGEG